MPRQHPATPEASRPGWILRGFNRHEDPATVTCPGRGTDMSGTLGAHRCSRLQYVAAPQFIPDWINQLLRKSVTVNQLEHENVFVDPGPSLIFPARDVRSGAD